MIRVKIAELKNHLSEYLRRVESGADLVVTDRDRPIAKIVPHSGARASTRLRPPVRPFRTVRNKRYSPARWKVGSLDLLLEERQKR